MAQAPQLTPLYPQNWVGRLILPQRDQRSSEGEVLFEVKQAPADQGDAWVGKTLRLSWSDAPDIGSLAHVDYTAKTQESKDQGNVHPDRLQGWNGISPLESLAGGHGQDDVLVRLPEQTELNSAGNLLIHDAPTQVAGTHGALLEVATASPDGLTLQDGRRLAAQLPEQRVDAGQLRGRYLATGNLGPNGFELKALRSEDVLRAQPNHTVSGKKACLDFIKKGIWADTAAKVNRSERILLNPNGSENPFRAGEKYLVLHLFGEIRGRHGDSERPLGLVPGHFAYGTAEIKPNPVNGESEISIDYRQIYAHGPEGILSGSQDWNAYMGDLKTGRYVNRPNCDLVVRHPSLQREHTIAGQSFSFFEALEEEASRLEARYRTGDGDGLSKVTMATSCTQDSAQAMFAVLERLDRMADSGAVKDYLQAHPDSSESRDFEAMKSLGKAMRKVLTPVFGLAPRGWRDNADRITSAVAGSAVPGQTLGTFLSWRTMLPRKHHEAMAQALVKNGAEMMAVVTHGLAFPQDSRPVAPNFPFSANYSS